MLDAECGKMIDLFASMSKGEWIESRISSIQFQMLSGLRIALTGAASAPSSNIGRATIR
jgi:hypothetical protein